MRVWWTQIQTSDGELHEGYVIADKAVDAGVILGDRIRVLHGFQPGEETGGLIDAVESRLVSSTLAPMAINHDQENPNHV